MLSVLNYNPETKLFHINASESRHRTFSGQYHVSWPCAISVGSHDGRCSAAMELRLLIGFGVEHCLHLAFKTRYWDEPNTDLFRLEAFCTGKKKIWFPYSVGVQKYFYCCLK